jgi:methylphosphotriester-DNA--protein-cysteine methyltransferase
MGDLARRWTLADIAKEVGGSPVYLTQVFQQVDGLPLYRYQMGLRLARALIPNEVVDQAAIHILRPLLLKLKHSQRPILAIQETNILST